MKITKTALKFKTSVYVLLALIVIMGSIAYRDLPLEASPDVAIPIIMVSTVYPGVAPAEMETLVTNILERDLKDLKNVQKMTSSSSESVSMIKIEFDSDVDMDDAYQKTRDKVDQAKADLPADAEDPVLIEINISEFPIMLVNVYGDADLMKLKQIGEDLEDQIEAIPGVLSVDVAGGLEREIQVQLNPERMEYYSIGVGKVLMRIRQEHLNMPGGNLELGSSRYLVRLVGEFKDPKKIEDIVLKAPKGNPIKLRDVGRVVDGFKQRSTISRVNGKECVTLRIKKRTGENIVRIADDVRVLLAEARPNLPKGVDVLIRQDESKTIRGIVKDLENSIISGLILVLLVLFFFLGLRNALFVAIAIPLSMLISFSLLAAMGVTLNMVVLFSLILALGMLVDNSIVVVENIFRHASEGASRFDAAYEGTREVAWPIIASTATTVAVFAPMLFWPGIMGEFMSFMPLTVITTLLSSLFVALVINPVIAATFLRQGEKMFDDSGKARGWILSGYQRALNWSLRFPRSLIGVATLSLVTTLILYSMWGAGVEFFPQTTPERAQAKIAAAEGTLLVKTDRLTARVENISASAHNVDDVVASVGMGGGRFGGGRSANQAVLNLEFKDRNEAQGSSWDTIDDLREQLAKLSGGQFQIEAQKMGPPTGAAVEVEISGEDYRVLSQFSRQIQELLPTVKGVVDIKDDYDPGTPELRIEVDREKAMLRKVNTAGIAQALGAAINGTKASVLREGEEEYDIVVRYELAHRSSINDVLDIRVTGKDDIQIPLRDVASVRTTSGVGSINHIDRKRAIKISGDVSGRSSTEVLVDVRKLLSEKIKMPNGYRLNYAGENEEQEKASAFLGKAYLVGLFLIALILVTQFNSVLRPLIILGSIVMSMIGVFLGLMLTGHKFCIMMTGMGVISLAGIVVNNAIVLIDYINQLREKHNLSLLEAVKKGGLVRFRPVVMTAITTILGMLPMAIGVSIDFTTFGIDTGSNSTQWWGPMAQAVIFGLLVATIMTLVLIPVMYYVQVRFTDKTMAWLRRMGRKK